MSGAERRDNLTVREFETFLAVHIKEHDGLDKHISILHNRMWNIGQVLIYALFGVIAWLLVSGGFLNNGG